MSKLTKQHFEAIAKRDKFLQEQALTRNKALIDEEITKAGNREIGMRVAADRLQGQVDTRTGMPIEQNITDAQLIRKAATLPAIPKAEVGMPEKVTPAPDRMKSRDELISDIEKTLYMTTLERNILGIICDCFAYAGVDKKEATRHQAVVTRRIAHWITDNYILAPKDVSTLAP